MQLRFRGETEAISLATATFTAHRIDYFTQAIFRLHGECRGIIETIFRCF